MKLLVEAPISAALFRTGHGRSSLADGVPEADVMAAALVVRQRYRLGDDGLEAEPALHADERIRHAIEPRHDHGEILPDEIAPRTGTDVIVIGEAVTAEAVIATRVGVKVGPYDVKLDVFGDRFWESVLGQLVPSDPAPFMRMPITYANAYGGAAAGDYGPIPWYKNPAGKGYCLRSSEAKGAPLPNVESATARIACWDDRPDPVGLAPYPSEWGLRWEQFVLIDAPRARIHVLPERGMFDRAHPLLSGQDVEPGPMVIAGMSEHVLRFGIPRCPVEAHIHVGGTDAVRDLALEEILVDVPARVVELSWRKMFRYPLFAHQARETRVVERARPGSQPHSER